MDHAVDSVMTPSISVAGGPWGSLHGHTGSWSPHLWHPCVSPLSPASDLGLLETKS